MTYKKVSIIIPCYNAERWIAEAIDSCLAQTYPSIETIVIDDGSTDRSLEIIKSYGDKITCETGENKGGNHARNRGVALSKGSYIQFLDADDYILPEKIAKQVSFLEQSKLDVVYGDWRHQKHFHNDRFVLEDIQITGEQTDILESLLSNWWVSPACILFARSAVEKSALWDETLKAGQDLDFFVSVVINGARVGYQPGCDSIYRRYGNITVSSSCKVRHLENHSSILQKIENELIQRQAFTEKYRSAIAQSYFAIARSYLAIEPKNYYKFLDKTYSLCPNFQPDSKHRTKAFNLAQKIVGFKNLEKVVSTTKLARTLLKQS